MADIDRDFFEQEDDAFDQNAKIRVIGVGGGGNNAVDRMIEDRVEGIDFIAANTDAQVLRRSQAPVRIQLGEKLTGGLGAGNEPQKGAKAAEESKEAILSSISGSNMLFVTAGMGGGTGTGAAPVIAGLAKDMGILTVGVVTKPFSFEGKARMNNALRGIEELKKSVDTLLVIPNESLMNLMHEDEDISMKGALKKADEVLKNGVEGIASLISSPGLINLDFADVKRIMADKGVAHIGIGRASGKNRAEMAVQTAIDSPLLETSIRGASYLLVNIMGDDGVGLKEVTKIGELIANSVGTDDVEAIYGTSINESLNDEIVVTIVATGFGGKSSSSRPPTLREVGRPDGDGEIAGEIDQNDDETGADAAAKSEEQIILPIFLQKNKR